MNLSIGFKLYPKGQVPKHVAFTQHMGDNTDLDIPPGQVVRTDGYFRLPRAAVLSAFQPHMHNRGKAMCMEAIYPDIRADSARPGPARTETINCVSNYQFGWHITYPYADDVAPMLPAGTIIHVTSWHDNTAGEQVQPEPAQLGRLRPADDRRDELRLGQPLLHRRGGVPGADEGAQAKTNE